MEGAYEDAYHQFIEPVVGASGEQLTRQSAPPTRRQTPSRDDGAPISEMLANLDQR
jgi:hypothetical protein